MTTAQFDAPASSTPRRIAASSRPSTVEAIASRVVRLVWLTARLVRRESVSVDLYRERFGRSLRSFRRDIAVLRDAGMYIEAIRDDYRMTCFLSDSDAA